MHISGDLVNGSMTVAKNKIVAGVGIGIGLGDGTPINVGPDAQSVGLSVFFPGAPPLVPAFSVQLPAGGIPGTSPGLWARYGVNDKLDVGAGYSFALKEFQIKGQLLATAGYQVLTGSAGGKLDLAARAYVGYDVNGEALVPVQLGADVRYRVSNKLAILSGNQLVLGLADSNKSKYLQLPVYAAFQLNEKLALHGGTNLAVIKIADSNTQFIGADFLMLNAGALYAVSEKLTVAGSISWFDLLDFSDQPTLNISARFAM
jgi:hypothetical protein